MGGIGLDRVELPTPRIVEGVDQYGIALKRLRRRDILDPMPLPQPVGPAEGREATLRRNSGAGQNDDIADSHRATLESESRWAKARSASALAAGISRRGAVCSIPTSNRRRRSLNTHPARLARSRSTQPSTAARSPT